MKYAKGVDNVSTNQYPALLYPDGGWSTGDDLDHNLGRSDLVVRVSAISHRYIHALTCRSSGNSEDVWDA
jgi:hypothetical protein